MDNTRNKSCEGKSLARWHIVYHKSKRHTFHMFIDAVEGSDALKQAIELNEGKNYKNCSSRDRSKYTISGMVDTRFYEKHKATDYEKNF